MKISGKTFRVTHNQSQEKIGTGCESLNYLLDKLFFIGIRECFAFHTALIMQSNIRLIDILMSSDKISLEMN